MEKSNKSIILRWIPTVLIITGTVLFIMLYNDGMIAKKLGAIFSSRDALREYIAGFGILAPLVFVIIQFIQVIIAPIPGSITGAAAGALFGWKIGFLLSSIGLILGSLTAYYLARLLGRPLVDKFVKPEIMAKYKKVVKGRQSVVLFLLFLIPFFPDDALCFLVGLSDVPLLLFFTLVIFGRLPGMLVASLTGAGLLILNPWQWVIIGVIAIGFTYVIWKHSQRIEDWFYNRILKKK